MSSSQVTTRLSRTLVVLVAALGGAALLSGCGGSSTNSSQTCSYDGATHEAGERFPSTDGCNTCSCDEQGRVACTLLACETCESVSSRYAGAIEAAKTCDPNASGQCTQLITEGLACGCGAFVNSERSDDIAAAQAAREQYSSMSCGQGIVCGACLDPVSGYCSAEGHCESLSDFDPPACKVGGIVYKSGTGGIPDPVSCNQCECQSGELACTEIGCEKPCPDGTTYAQQCAECGPTDACLVVEHACLPSCTDACAEGVCLDGVCRKVCG